MEVLPAYVLKHPLALILEYAVFFLHLQSPRQSLETSLQAVLESFMQTPVVVHEKNLFLQRFRGALEKRILFAYSKIGAVSREGRWTLFAQGPNVLRA